jgi:hypothetical protein
MDHHYSLAFMKGKNGGYGWKYSEVYFGSLWMLGSYKCE